MARRKQRQTPSYKKRAKRNQWIAIGVVVAVVVAALAIFLLTRPPSVEGVEEFADQGNQHIEAPASTYIYNSRPPTSGPHSPQIAAWGEHDETVSEWNQVHNLEDGGVIMHYNCPDGCPDVVEELRSILENAGEERLILHPYENMDSRIALTAWTHMITMDEVDRERIEAFIERYRGVDHHK